jgi:hypothetical protein
MPTCNERSETGRNCQRDNGQAIKGSVDIGWFGGRLRHSQRTHLRHWLIRKRRLIYLTRYVREWKNQWNA